MLDNGHEMWLWQGWWPEREDDLTLVDQTGSGAVRWQEERKAAMQTVVNYCMKESSEKPIPAYLVWAGLEPLAFTNLFPFWRDRDDIAETNMKVIKELFSSDMFMVQYLIVTFRKERKQVKR